MYINSQEWDKEKKVPNWKFSVGGRAGDRIEIKSHSIVDLTSLFLYVYGDRIKRKK